MLSKEQKMKNRKMFGCENLKVPRSIAVDKLKNLLTLLRSDLYSVRQKLDLIIANYEETLTDNIVIIKCPIMPKAIGGVSFRIPSSGIIFVVNVQSKSQQIWIPFDEWDRLGKDFEAVYKKYIDWELITMYK